MSGKNVLRNGLLVVLVGTIVVSAGCERKKRLSGGESRFVITPPAATVLKNATITLSAHGGGTTEVNPVWEISPANAGSLSPGVGPVVEFTPTLLGDVDVVATYDGAQARSEIAVVTSTPLPTAFDVYTDGFFVNEPALTGPGFLVSLGTDPDEADGTEREQLSEESTGYTPQGENYFRLVARRDVGSDSAFWAVTAADPIDLNAFAAGSLRFALRISPEAGGAPLRVRVEVTDNVIARGVNLDSTHGFSRLTTDWQEVSIPVSEFTAQGINIASIENPFALKLENMDLGDTITLDSDAIRWQR